MTSPAQNLNRLFTVSGQSPTTQRVPIAWGFDTRIEQGSFPENVEPGSYFVRREGGFFGTLLMATDTSAQAIVDLNLIYAGWLYQPVNEDGTLQTGTDPLTVVTIADEQNWIRISTPEAYAAGNYIQANVTFISIRANSVETRLADGVLVGDDFTWGPDTFIQIRFERHEHDQTITAVSDIPVWGRLSERGSQVGIVQLSVDGPVTSESQENAVAIVRYAPNLAIGTSLTDDLGRVWTIAGSRTLQERRFLEYDLTRTVST